MTTDEYYVDIKRDDNRGYPMFLGLTAIDQIARQLGFLRDVDVEALEAEVTILRQAEMRWNQIYDTLADVGFHMSDDDRVWFDSLRPRVADARALSQGKFHPTVGDDQELASTAKLAEQPDSVQAPLFVPNVTSGDGDKPTITLG